MCFHNYSVLWSTLDYHVNSLPWYMIMVIKVPWSYLHTMVQWQYIFVYMKIYGQYIKGHFLLYECAYLYLFVTKFMSEKSFTIVLITFSKLLICMCLCKWVDYCRLDYTTSHDICMSYSKQRWKISLLIPFKPLLFWHLNQQTFLEQSENVWNFSQNYEQVFFR